MNLGKTIKLIRISSGLKQKELAEKVGVTSNYLSLVESEKREPSISFLKALSKELDVPIEFFFWDSSKKVSEFDDNQKAIYESLKELMLKLFQLRGEIRKK